MTEVPPTQPQPVPAAAPANSTPARSEGGVDLPTLIITALASAVAAYVCSKVWKPGTLASAAFTPVLVALVKEALRRPTEVVTTVVPVPVVTPRRRRRLAAPDAPTAVMGSLSADGDPAPGSDIPPPAIVAVEPQPVTTTRTRGRQIHWRIAVLTGLLGFAICAAFYTLPELIAGSAASGGGKTTLFGGGTHTVQHTTTVKTNTVVVPGKTVTQTTPTTTVTTAATTPTTPATTQATAPTTPTTPATTQATAPTTPTTPATTGTTQATTPTTTTPAP